jgi:hypothetical protein
MTGGKASEASDVLKRSQLASADEGLGWLGVTA